MLGLHLPNKASVVPVASHPPMTEAVSRGHDINGMQARAGGKQMLITHRLRDLHPYDGEDGSTHSRLMGTRT